MKSAIFTPKSTRKISKGIKFDLFRNYHFQAIESIFTIPVVPSFLDILACFSRSGD